MIIEKTAKVVAVILLVGLSSCSRRSSGSFCGSGGSSSSAFSGCGSSSNSGSFSDGSAFSGSGSTSRSGSFSVKPSLCFISYKQ